MATLGKSVVQPLADELKSWAPTEKKNQDVSATLVRYQIYKLLGELADKAATDKGLQAALKGRLNALKTTYVPKETVMVQKAIKARLNQMESAPYVGANAALREAIDKISALRAAKP